MVESFLGWLTGSPVGSGTMAEAQAEAMRQQMVFPRQCAAAMVADYMSMTMWQRRKLRPPGIYWTRTGGRTHTVEIVR